MTMLHIVYWILLGSMLLAGLLFLVIFIAAAWGPKDQRRYEWEALAIAAFAWFVPACQLIPGFSP